MAPAMVLGPDGIADLAINISRAMLRVPLVLFKTEGGFGFIIDLNHHFVNDSRLIKIYQNPFYGKRRPGRSSDSRRPVAFCLPRTLNEEGLAVCLIFLVRGLDT
jgi:hypothetical protein